MSKTEVFRVFRRWAMYLAIFWSDEMRPTPFDEMFVHNGARVRLTIDEYHGPSDPEPLRSAVDEDDRIAD